MILSASASPMLSVYSVCSVLSVDYSFPANRTSWYAKCGTTERTERQNKTDEFVANPRDRGIH